MNREQRRSAEKVRRKATAYKLPSSTAAVANNPRSHFLLGVAAFLRHPIDCIKSIGALVDMNQGGK